jgi:hypothetical protein
MNRKNIMSFSAAAALTLGIFTSGLNAQGNGNGNAGTNSTQNVNVVNTPTVNVGTMPAVTIAASSTVLPTKDASTYASQIVNLWTNLPIAAGTTGGLYTASSAYSVPAGQTLVITDIDISPVNPAAGINHVVLLSSATGGGAPFALRDFKVTNGTSSHFAYHTGIVVNGGATGMHFIVVNGSFDFSDPTPSTGPVSVAITGYLTNN